MNDLSNRLMALSESETLVMSQKSAELKAQGVDVINLSVGEPDFATPNHIKEAAKKAIDNNFSFYSPAAGFPDLRKAVCEKLKKENGLIYTPNQIVCSNGAKQSICNVILAMVNSGDEVIIPAPYWVSYPEMVKLAEGTPVVVSAGIDQDFKITGKQLEETITPKTKAVIICSPSNPTGSVYSKAELRALADVLIKHPHVYVISDEIYEHINYIGKHESMAQFEELSERMIIVNGVSKCYAMTGWRIGWMAAPTSIAKACTKLQGQYTSGPCSISQKAALAAYEGSQDEVETMRQAFERRKKLAFDLLSDIDGLEVNDPQGAFYLFPKCSSFFGKSHEGRTIEDSADLAIYLLEEGHVACVAGQAFGAPNNIRLSYATSDDNLVEAVKRIKTALDKLEVRS
ncbi:MAG TPA: pyridoxal phosphate-dependent aminotransferase [Dysgonamonadaceae bacterium]|nr:pyridoxal phosphate-dependent aminotransferase [Dysgonamonadaceae bacterium]